MPKRLSHIPAVALAIRHFVCLICLLHGLLAPIGATESVDQSIPDSLFLQNIPKRPQDAITGTQFGRETTGMTNRERQIRAQDELLRGNVPDFLRNLKPDPLPPGPKMRSSEYYLRHQEMIRAQRKVAGCTLGGLVSGHKKDIVLTNRLNDKPGRIAIYGWHRKTSEPIQPLSTVHGERYADYSHGVRLIYKTVWINGQPRSILEVLQDPRLASVLTHEGLIARLLLMLLLK